MCALAIFSTELRAALIAGIPLALVVWMFSRLTITIDGEKLRAAFGPGIVYKTIRLAEIASCEPVRIKWWEGWGIHLSRFGWLYNVSGWHAVAIRLRNGKRLALGTDQPNELSEAIRRRASAR
jgi:hypothetical protein